MGLGALGIFFTNVGLKSILSDYEYYDYSVIVTVLSLIASFGALGLDQVFLRLSRVNGKVLYFDEKLVPIAILNTLITSFVSYVYLIHIIEVGVNGFLIFILCFSSILIMLFYNLTRLSSLFVVSQLIQNSWKILFGAMMVALFFNENLYYYFFTICCVFIVLMLIISILYLRKKIKFKRINKYTNKEVFSFSFHFFLALLTVSFLSQGDRILVERIFTESDFGDYFYLATLFLFPFSLFQSYIGFKELVYIKNGPINIVKKLKTIIYGSLLFSVVLCFSVALLAKYNFINLDVQSNKWIIFIFLIIGNIKMIYSLFSAVIGAKATLKEIKVMNIIFISISFFILVVSWRFIETLEALIATFSILWLTRLVIWGCFSKSYIFNEV
jgi:O-antigen/teichoic acid export membrane protein